MSYPRIDLVKTGQNISRLRRRAGYSVRDLQRELGLGLGSPQSIYKWQAGTALPSIDNLVALAALFGVQLDDILAVEQADGR